MQLFKDGKHLYSRVTDYIEDARRGDTRAQKAIYDALSGKMFAVCLRYMGDRDSAEDILQDGFVTLFTKLDSFSGDGSFEGWARKIFVNTALMSLRKRDVLKQSEDVQEAVQLSSEEPSPVQSISYKDLLKLISELPPGFEGYSHKEISEALDISESTSRSQLLRARAILQSKIKER